VAIPDCTAGFRCLGFWVVAITSVPPSALETAIPDNIIVAATTTSIILFMLQPPIISVVSNTLSLMRKRIYIIA
jgi:hypothetical protein